MRERSVAPAQPYSTAMRPVAGEARGPSVVTRQGQYAGMFGAGAPGDVTRHGHPVSYRCWLIGSLPGTPPIPWLHLQEAWNRLVPVTGGAYRDGAPQQAPRAGGTRRPPHPLLPGGPQPPIFVAAPICPGWRDAAADAWSSPCLRRASTGSGRNGLRRLPHQLQRSNHIRPVAPETPLTAPWRPVSPGWPSDGSRSTRSKASRIAPAPCGSPTCVLPDAASTHACHRVTPPLGQCHPGR